MLRPGLPEGDTAVLAMADTGSARISRSAATIVARGMRFKVCQIGSMFGSE